MADTTSTSVGPEVASPGAIKYLVLGVIFIVICLLNFLISNLPTFLDMALLAIAVATAFAAGRKSNAWY